MSTQQIQNMITYVLGLREGKNTLAWYKQYEQTIKTIQPAELFDVFHALLEQGVEAAEILVFLDKVTNVIYNDMNKLVWKRPQPNSFLGVLMAENAGLVQLMDQISEMMKQKLIASQREEFTQLVEQLASIEHHYQKKENILFSMMEKKEAKFDGTSIMWALHDEIRKGIKEVIALLHSDPFDETTLNIKFGSLYFTIRGLVVKEEMILFPTATSLFDEMEMMDMYHQMFEYEFSFIDAPKKPDMDLENHPSSLSNDDSLQDLMIHMETGSLSFAQVEMLFNALPLDLSYVDENNKLRFFTKPKDRIFPRSPAAIGRDVKQCHPPKSVHVVMDIIDAFRSGEQDTASFWIPLNGKFVLIQYFAIRDKEGNYRGVLEASQDITEIRTLDGERRLVSWGK